MRAALNTFAVALAVAGLQLALNPVHAAAAADKSPTKPSSAAQAPKKAAAPEKAARPAEEKPEIPRAAPRKPVVAVDLPGSVDSGPLMKLKLPSEYAVKLVYPPPRKPVPDDIPASWVGLSPVMSLNRLTVSGSGNLWARSMGVVCCVAAQHKQHRTISGNSLMLDDILFCGDPHGSFAQITQAAAATGASSFVLLGDLDLDRPLDRIVAPLARKGVRGWWIPGNHDSDSEEWHDRLFLSGMADRGLFGRVVEIDGVRVAGLGGVFRSKVWHPHDGSGRPRFSTRADFMRANWNERWRDGLPLRHRTTIFPEDFETLADMRADILVTHEAPSSHRHGFAEIDDLAEAMGVKAVVHGHHHETYEAILPNGIAVFGVEDRAVLHGGKLLPGFSDQVIPGR